jgi:hypothetical protein
MLAALPILEFLASIFALSVFLGGCASPGEPVGRKPPVPQAVTDLAGAQSGNDVILTFTLPKETADRRPLKQFPAIEIYRSFVAPSPSANAGVSATQPPTNAALLVTIPSAMVDHYAVQNHVRYPDSLKEKDFAQHIDWIARYMVRTRASPKRSSPDSNPVDVRIYPALDPIEDLKAEVTHSAIVLTWTPPQKTLAGAAPAIAAYRIYRAEKETLGTENTAAENTVSSGEPADLKFLFTKIGEADSPSFRDAQFEFGKMYVYSVRTVAQYPDEMLESGHSKFAVVTPRNVFPPSAPEGLVVVLVPAQGEIPAYLDLSWAINPETDIAGYNVYRSVQVGVSGTRANRELLLTPAFRDMNTEPGRRYFYTVTAVDRSGNESSASAAASGGVPVGNQPTP